MNPVLSSKFSVPEDVLCQELNGEIVLLNMKNEYYYTLNYVGSRMWQLLVENKDLEVVLQDLLQIFSADETTLRQHLTALVEELVTEGLLING
jgi:hypothetical protein